MAHHLRIQRSLVDYGDGEIEGRHKRLMLRIEPSLYAALKARAGELVPGGRASVSELLRSYAIEGLERDGVELY